MSKPSRSKFKNVFLLWAITYVHFYVQGHPIFTIDGMARVSGQAEGAGAATHVENANNDFRVASSFVHETPDGGNLGTSAAASHPGTGSGDVKIAETMGKGHLNGIDALREQTKNLGSGATSLAGKFDDSRSTSQVTDRVKASEKNPELNNLPVEDTPNKALDLDTGSDTATQNSDLAAGQVLKAPGQDGKEISPAHSTSETSKGNLKDHHPPSGKDAEENLLGSTPKDEEIAALKASVLAKTQSTFDEPNMAFGGKMKDLKVDQLSQLKPDDLIGYMAERNSFVNDFATYMKKAEEDYSKARKEALTEASKLYNEFQVNVPEQIDAFAKIQKEYLKAKGGPSQQDIAASIERNFITLVGDSGMATPKMKASLQKLMETETAYQKAYTNAYTAAHQLSSSKLFTPEALSHLTNKQYVERAAILNKKAHQLSLVWLSKEEVLQNTVNTWYPIATAGKSDEEVSSKMKAITLRLEQKAMENGHPIDKGAIQTAAQLQFIKEQEKFKPFRFETWRRAAHIESAKSGVQRAKSAALRAADGVFKNNKILGSADLRHETTGLRFQRFFKNIFAWLFRREKHGKENSTAATTVKPSTGDRLIEKRPSDTATKQDPSKAV
ncbi:hypothetical protein DFH28DRAFT_314095 [Melampsora americana]|nr:hypothetical protein DFH28DRAFT_314095 [Melampsora americana]